MEYKKPCICTLDGKLLNNNYTQYIINITNEYCYGLTHGDPYGYEFLNGYEASFDTCDSRAPHVGTVIYLKCLETEDRVYEERVVDVTSGGSAQCEDWDTPVVVYLTFNPSLPQTCTVTSSIMEGRDCCDVGEC